MLAASRSLLGNRARRPPPSAGLATSWLRERVCPDASVNDGDSRSDEPPGTLDEPTDLCGTEQRGAVVSFVLEVEDRRQRGTKVLRTLRLHCRRPVPEAHRRQEVDSCPMVLATSALTKQPAAKGVTGGDRREHGDSRSDVVVVVVAGQRSVAGDQLRRLEVGHSLTAASPGLLASTGAPARRTHADRSNTDARLEPATVTPSSSSEATSCSPDRSCCRTSRLVQSRTCNRFPVQRWTAARRSCTCRTHSRFRASVRNDGRISSRSTSLSTSPSLRAADPKRTADTGAGSHSASALLSRLGSSRSASSNAATAP